MMKMVSILGCWSGVDGVFLRTWGMMEGGRFQFRGAVIHTKVALLG